MPKVILKAICKNFVFSLQDFQDLNNKRALFVECFLE